MSAHCARGERASLRPQPRGRSGVLKRGRDGNARPVAPSSVRGGKRCGRQGPRAGRSLVDRRPVAGGGSARPSAHVAGPVCLRARTNRRGRPLRARFPDAPAPGSGRAGAHARGPLRLPCALEAVARRRRPAHREHRSAGTHREGRGGCDRGRSRGGLGVENRKERILFLCMRRPPLATAREKARPHPFGQADEHGLVGESSAIWDLREEVAFFAKRQGHVLITGPSGSGKELVARSIHALSTRASHRFIARSAATIPPALVDAELFGNVGNYPNAGMPERPGLFGESDGGTLFLDEIGEMSSEAQAHLLRVLDSGGEYQRLGDAKRRTSDVRLVAATNRSPDALKHDFLARFPFRIQVCGFGRTPRGRAAPRAASPSRSGGARSSGRRSVLRQLERSNRRAPYLARPHRRVGTPRLHDARARAVYPRLASSRHQPRLGARPHRRSPGRAQAGARGRGGSFPSTGGRGHSRGDPPRTREASGGAGAGVARARAIEPARADPSLEAAWDRRGGLAFGSWAKLRRPWTPSAP